MPELSQSSKPNKWPPSAPGRSPVQQATHKRRKNRRQYALQELESESSTAQQQGISSMLATYGLNLDGKTYENADLQKRAGRYYGDQILVPHEAVLRCINAIDRARRARRSHARRPNTEVSAARKLQTSTLYDITPILRRPAKTKSVAQASRETCDSIEADDEGLDEDEIPHFFSSDDDPGEEFDSINYEPMSEHNGTVRRWYRGFRH